jgi:hypothetical protein
MCLRVVSLPLSGMPYLGRTQGLVVHAQLRASSLYVSQPSCASPDPNDSMVPSMVGVWKVLDVDDYRPGSASQTTSSALFRLCLVWRDPSEGTTQELQVHEGIHLGLT